MKSTLPCPNCNKVLEPVYSKDGILLGYFCLNILNKSCTYINVKPSNS